MAELAEFGITIAPTTWLEKKQTVNLSQLISVQNNHSYFLKPVIGADSSNTLRFDDTANGLAMAQKHLDDLLPTQAMMLQPYIKSVETWGETSSIYFSGNLSHAVRKIPVIGDYRVQDTFGATDISYQPNSAEMALAKACLQYLTEKFGEILYARFDFLQGDDGCVYLNEAELIEPSLFFNHNESAALKMAQAIKNKIK